MKNHPARFAVMIAVALLTLLAGCKGVPGEDGAFTVKVFAHSSTTGITLTELGIPVNNTVPSSNTSFKTNELKGRIYWSTTTPINFFVNISQKPNEGEPGSDGLLPYNDALELAPLTATKGEDGEDLNYQFYFNNDQFFLLKSRHVLTGTAF